MTLMQTILENELILLTPIRQSDFEKLYEVASDPLIWVQHPSWDRYKKAVFLDFFNVAMESKGGYVIREQKTGEIIGSSRYYEYN
ncbi:MAG TPA: GNAT family N-acetyltransferase, partial [Pedobacter sp.]|nr:GNAT family N-acetyltransferase [Pedobacter sp.]